MELQPLQEEGLPIRFATVGKTRVIGRSKEYFLYHDRINRAPPEGDGHFRVTFEGDAGLNLAPVKKRIYVFRDGVDATSSTSHAGSCQVMEGAESLALHRMRQHSGRGRGWGGD